MRHLIISFGFVFAAAANSACSGGKATPPTSPSPAPQACRSFATATVLTFSTCVTGLNGTSCNSGLIDISCKYDRAANRLLCDDTRRVSGFRSTTVADYGSSAAFVAETSVLPPLTRAPRVTTTDEYGIVTVTERSFVDGRLASETQTQQFPSSSIVSPPTTTTTFTAWDAAGRPTSGMRTQSGSSGALLSLTYTYNDQARTRTLRIDVNGDLSSEGTTTYDPAGYAVASSVRGQNPDLTDDRRYDILATDRVCP